MRAESVRMEREDKMKQILCNKYEVLKIIAEVGLGVVYLVKEQK